MKIIGITGATGAGKSSVCAELKKRGADIIDADDISRMVTKSNGAAFNEVVEFFGIGILNEDNEINRSMLGGIVFNDPAKLSALNSIVHKHVFKEMQKRLMECEKDIAVLDVPLLFTNDFPIKCDLTVAVVADPKIRLERIIKRDNISREAAIDRMKNQLKDEEYCKLADVCFENDGDSEKIKDFVDELLNIE